jgi:hypothetical protein
MDSKNNATDKKLSEAETAALIRGQKLGFLIATSTLPDDVKDELVVLAEKMSEEQQDRLLDVFEAKYLDEKTAEADNKLKEALESFLKKNQAEDDARAKSLAAAIDKI